MWYAAAYEVIVAEHWPRNYGQEQLDFMNPFGF